MAEPTYRVNLSLPADLAVEIADIAKALRVSQSALITTLLRSPVGKLAMYMSMSPPLETDPDGVTMRLRGKSREEVTALIEQAVVESMSVDPLL